MLRERFPTWDGSTSATTTASSSHSTRVRRAAWRMIRREENIDDAVA
jgi:hypothetical protein